MWTFTAYIIARLVACKSSENKDRKVGFSELRHFMFNKLWKQYRLALNDSSTELLSELKYLQDLGIIRIYESDDDLIIEVTNPELLKDIEDKVRNSPVKYKISLYNQYLDRIDEAINDYKGIL